MHDYGYRGLRDQDEDEELRISAAQPRPRGLLRPSNILWILRRRKDNTNSDGDSQK